MSEEIPPGTHATPKPEQVFITGSARSGTSVTIRLVRSLLGGDYSSRDEGHLLDVIATLDRGVDDFFSVRKAYYRTFRNMTIAHADPEALKARLWASVLSLHTEALGERFIDKTHGPDMVWSLPSLRRTLPGSKAIFTRRRFNEYLRSARKKFPFWSFKEQVEHWTSTMDAWRVVRRDLGSWCLEVEHMDLVERPEAVARAVLGHLGLPERRARSATRFLRRNSPEKTRGGTYEPVALEELGLSADQLALARRRTRLLMRQFGYGAGRDYYA